MNPQPLKGKTFVLEYGEEIVYVKDIRSAVEWFIEMATCCGEDKGACLDCDATVEKIKEAFEDVMK